MKRTLWDLDCGGSAGRDDNGRDSTWRRHTEWQSESPGWPTGDAAVNLVTQGEERGRGKQLQDIFLQKSGSLLYWSQCISNVKLLSKWSFYLLRGSDTNYCFGNPVHQSSSHKTGFSKSVWMILSAAKVIVQGCAGPSVAMPEHSPKGQTLAKGQNPRPPHLPSPLTSSTLQPSSPRTHTPPSLLWTPICPSSAPKQLHESENFMSSAC